MTRRSIRQKAKDAIKVTEKSFQGQVLELARLLGWRCYFTWHSYHSPSGYPDLCLLRPPRLIFAEIKSETGKITAAQDDWLGDLMRIPGLEVFVWRPSDFEKITEVLR